MAVTQWTGKGRSRDLPNLYGQGDYPMRSNAVGGHHEGNQQGFYYAYYIDFFAD